MSTYAYSITNDFGGDIPNYKTLHQSVIDDVTITTGFDGILSGGDGVTFHFTSALSAPEIAELDTIVSTHDNVVVEETTIDIEGKRLTNVLPPVDLTDAATKTYVDVDALTDSYILNLIGLLKTGVELNSITLTTVGAGTVTVPSNSTYARVTLRGGSGGGGGGANYTGSGDIFAGSGGGGSGYNAVTTSIAEYAVGNLTSISYVVGDGGNGGGQHQNGSQGGATSISSFGITATGGDGGNRGLFPNGFPTYGHHIIGGRGGAGFGAGGAGGGSVFNDGSASGGPGGQGGDSSGFLGGFGNTAGGGGGGAGPSGAGNTASSRHGANGANPYAGGGGGGGTLDAPSNSNGGTSYGASSSFSGGGFGGNYTGTGSIRVGLGGGGSGGSGDLGGGGGGGRRGDTSIVTAASGGHGNPGISASGSNGSGVSGGKGFRGEINITWLAKLIN